MKTATYERSEWLFLLEKAVRVHSVYIGAARDHHPNRVGVIVAMSELPALRNLPVTDLNTLLAHTCSRIQWGKLPQASVAPHGVHELSPSEI